MPMQSPAPLRQAAGFRPLYWADDALQLLDQRLLPGEERWLRIDSAEGVVRAIADMQVRGAPAIGLAAAYGLALAVREARATGGQWREQVAAVAARLRAARPTAVNLMWAVDRLMALLPGLDDDPAAAVLAEALAMHEADVAANLAMATHGAALLAPGSGVITHCNAGALATGGHGTALGVIRTAHAEGRLARVWADETRPWLQGARLTAWELLRDGIAVDLLADGAAAWRMHQGGVDWVIVGADRVAANGDVANKIGTYALALAARAHGVRVMVAAPLSTVDLETPGGADITIEERDPVELLALAGTPVAAAGAGAWNPVFDVTPAALVDCFVCERGVVHRPDTAGIAALFSS